MIDRYGDPCIFIEPNLSQIGEVNLLYDVIYKHYLRAGFFSEKEERNILRERGLFNKSDEDKLSILYKDLEKLNSEKQKYEFRSKVKGQITKAISIIDKEIKKITQKRGSLLTRTAQYMTSNHLNLLLLQKCLYIYNNDALELRWPTEKDMNEECDLDNLYYILQKIFYEGLVEEKIIRELARSEPFSTNWKVAKKNGMPLFKEVSFNILSPKYKLMYWANLYDAAMESYDAPSYDILNDDKLFDEWIYNKSMENREKSKGNKSVSQKFANNPKINNAEEVFLKVDSAEDAKNVYNTLNSPEAQRVLKERSAVINSGSSVKEGQLPDVKQKLKIARNNAIAMKHRKK